MPINLPGDRADPDVLVRVPMRDGVRLTTDVYLGARPTPGPAVLVRTPYGRRAIDSPVPLVARRLCAAGFTVVVQDVRGLGGSEGTPAPFIHAVADAADTLDWLERQSWCDGRVACWGSSYYGFTAWAAVATGHPAVCALVSRVTSVDPGALAWQDGVLRLGPSVDWVRTTWARSPGEAQAVDWSARPFGALVPEGAARFWLLGQSPEIHRVAATLQTALGRVPTLHCTGWFDLFATRQMQEWRAAARDSAPQYLLATATDHMDDEFDFAGRSRYHLQDEAACEAWLARTLDPVISFLHARFRGLPQRMAPVRWQLAGVGLRDSTGWPPPGVELQRLVLAAGTDGRNHALQGEVGSGHRQLAWVHDPLRLVPMAVSDWWRPLLQPADAQALAGRDDVLTFTSEPAGAPRDLAGPVVLCLSVRSTASICQIITSLCDVAPDDVSRILLTTPRRVLADGRLVRWTLGDLGYRQPAGHRLRLHLASSAFPLYAPPPPAGIHPLLADWFPARTQVLDLERCALVLTVLPPTGRADSPDAVAEG